MNTIFSYPSPLGAITLASDGEGLTGLWFEGQRYFGAGLDIHREIGLTPVFDQAVGWLELYFSGKEPNMLPLLGPGGTPFQQKVWRLLRAIPYGQVVTYGQLAKRLAEQEGKKVMSARAVGRAVGHNPISLMIPCHRVVGFGGSLTGYAGGIERKKRLLAMEGVLLTRDGGVDLEKCQWQPESQALQN